MLKTQLRHIDELDALIQKLDEEIKRRMHPFEEDLERLDTIPGVGRRTGKQVLGNRHGYESLPLGCPSLFLGGVGSR